MLNGDAMGRLNAWGPVLVKAVALAWAAWVLAGLLWLLSGHDRTPLPAMAARAASPRQASTDTSQLTTLDIFGTATAPDAPASDAPDTTLQLKLNGVFMSEEPKASSAIVSEASQPTGGKLYHVDDVLPGGATLSAVYEDRILIHRSDGGSETLRFEKANAGGPPPSLADGGFPGSNGFAQRGGGGPPGPGGIRAMLDHASSAMADAPEAYLQSMGLQHGDHGGYEVTQSAPQSVLQAGLKPGDRIVSINGQALGNPMRDRALLSAMKNEGSARVEVQRGDQTLTIDQKF